MLHSSGATLDKSQSIAAIQCYGQLVQSNETKSQPASKKPCLDSASNKKDSRGYEADGKKLIKLLDRQMTSMARRSNPLDSFPDAPSKSARIGTQQAKENKSKCVKDEEIQEAIISEPVYPEA